MWDVDGITENMIEVSINLNSDSGSSEESTDEDFKIKKSPRKRKRRHITTDESQDYGNFASELSAPDLDIEALEIAKNIIMIELDNDNIRDTEEDTRGQSANLRCLPIEELSELHVERSIVLPSNLHANRLVEIAYFVEQSRRLGIHDAKCTIGKMEFRHKTRNGLLSYFMYFCHIRENQIKIKTHHGDGVNENFVWDGSVIGLGYSQSEELLSVLNFPVMTKKTYKKLKMGLHDKWQQLLSKDMQKSADEEKKFVIEAGNLEDSFPYFLN
ncbi:hypothetical protein FQA39_LY09977 [Lamprigera yunnana]|nr:hypothetical protein FQA39_LY09977 [Lamprigera yunnana]